MKKYLNTFNLTHNPFIIHILIYYIIGQAQRRAAADPGTKVTGEFSTNGRIFPPNAQNGFLLFPSF